MNEASDAVEERFEGGKSSGSRRLPAAAIEAVPGLTVVAVFLAWAAASGGYFPRAWLSGGIFVGALILVLAATWFGGLAHRSRVAAVALTAFLGFTAWSYLAISWAQVRGDAWDGANRTALYLLVFALFALWRWTPLGAAAVLLAFSVGTCAIGVASLLSAAGADDVGAYFNDARFADPVGYPNGNAALFLLAFWPAVLLSSRRELPLLLRSLSLAAAAVLLQLAVLPQSRGAYAAFAAVALLTFLVAPDRLRVLVMLAPPAAALALTHGRLAELAAADDTAELAAGTRSAAELIGWTAVAVFLVGSALARLDASIRVPGRLATSLGRVAAVSALLALAASVVLAFVLANPRASVASAWEEFRSPPVVAAERVALDRGFVTNRVDLWRVALAEFRRQPVRGAGPDNFTVAYVRERTGYEETLYPHSFPLQVLSQTGVVGGALMLVLLAAAAAAAVRARLEEDALGAAVSAGGLLVFAYWLSHGSIDWLWELPALTGPAFAFLAMAGSVTSARAVRTARLDTALAAAVSLLVVVSFVFPWLAARETRYAAAAWRADAAGAADALERARRLNPLTDRADLTAGSIARRRGDWDGMAAAYERALERNPHSWYSHLQLSLARARQGDVAAARSSLEEAERLNPNEPLLELVASWLEHGEEVDVAEVTRILSDRYRDRTR